MSCYNKVIFCHKHQVYFKKGEQCYRCVKEGNKQMTLYEIVATPEKVTISLKRMKKINKEK